MESIRLFDALIVTLISLTLVFLVIIIISYGIRTLKSSKDRSKQEKAENNKIVKNEIKEGKIKENLNIEENREGYLEDEEEVVAVIASVIAASMGLEIPDIKIQKIRRIDKSVWIDTARREQMN